MPIPANQSCGNCAYSVVQDMAHSVRGQLVVDKGIVTCRINAPTSSPPPASMEQIGWKPITELNWPLTALEWWCARWSPTVGAADGPPLTSGYAATITGTANAADTMMGLGQLQGFVLTPKTTGRILAQISGICTSTLNQGGVNITGRHGTGTPPSNGTTGNPGTQWSITQHYVMISAKQNAGFSIVGGNVNLPLGVPQWFDIAIAAIGGGVASIQDVQIVLQEV
jgi:hypothetical protein